MPKPLCKGWPLTRPLFPPGCTVPNVFPELRDILHVPVLLPGMCPLTFFCLWSCQHWIRTVPRVWSDRCRNLKSIGSQRILAENIWEEMGFLGMIPSVPSMADKKTLQTTRESSPPWESREHEGCLVPAASALHWGLLVLAKWETHGDLLGSIHMLTWN